MTLDLNKKVLVVEDSSFMKKMFLKNLREIGFQDITVASNGIEAIDKIKVNQFELIISDWNMPEKDGLEILTWFRQQKQYDEIPFIMATAQGDKEKVETCRRAGSNGHVAKPFTAAQLKEAIEIAFHIREAKEYEAREYKITAGKVHLKIGHIQITDHLALGVLQQQIKTGVVTPKYFELETERMPGWNPIEKALETNAIDGAFVLAPIAMDLFAYDVPIRLVSFAHKNGSIFVRARQQEEQITHDYYLNKIVNIPHKLSIHHILAHEYLTEHGLAPGVPGFGTINVTFEVVPPIQMPKSLMLNKEVGGFIVAEPIGSTAVIRGIAQLEFISKSRWQDHPCCVVAMRDEILEQQEDAVYEFIALLQEAGQYIENNHEEAAEIALSFLDPEKKIGLTKEVLLNVLGDPMGITYHDLHPDLDDLDKIQRYMYDKMDIGKLIDLEKFTDLKYSHG